MALECKYVNSMTVGQHMMIVGEILNVAANKYNRVGEVVDKAFFAGVELLKK